MEYPSWVCLECGLKASKGVSHALSTWHEGKCDICKKNKPVTEPRDFYYPKFRSRKKVNKYYEGIKKNA